MMYDSSDRGLVSIARATAIAAALCFAVAAPLRAAELGRNPSKPLRCKGSSAGYEGIVPAIGPNHPAIPQIAEVGLEFETSALRLIADVWISNCEM